MYLDFFRTVTEMTEIVTDRMTRVGRAKKTGVTASMNPRRIEIATRDMRGVR